MESPEFYFLVERFRAVLKLEISSVSSSKTFPQKVRFQHFSVIENLNWSWKSHGKVSEFIAQLQCAASVQYMCWFSW